MGHVRGNGFNYPNGNKLTYNGSVGGGSGPSGRNVLRIVLLVLIPLVAVALIAALVWYVRKLLQRRQLNKTLKIKAVPHIFSNVYVSHKAFKRELSTEQVVQKTANIVVPERGSDSTAMPMNNGNNNNINNINGKTGSQLSMFREEALAAAPLIFSGPKSAPARIPSTGSLGSLHSLALDAAQSSPKAAAA